MNEPGPRRSVNWWVFLGIAAIVLVVATVFALWVWEPAGTFNSLPVPVGNAPGN